MPAYERDRIKIGIAHASKKSPPSEIDAISTQEFNRSYGLMQALGFLQFADARDRPRAREVNTPMLEMTMEVSRAT